MAWDYLLDRINEDTRRITERFDRFLLDALQKAGFSEDYLRSHPVEFSQVHREGDRTSWILHNRRCLFGIDFHSYLDPEQGVAGFGFHLVPPPKDWPRP